MEIITGLFDLNKYQNLYEDPSFICIRSHPLGKMILVISLGLFANLPSWPNSHLSWLPNLFTKKWQFLNSISTCLKCPYMLDHSYHCKERPNAVCRLLHLHGRKARCSLRSLEEQVPFPKQSPRTVFDHQAPVHFLSPQSPSSQPQSPLGMQFWVCLDGVVSN